MKRIQLRNVYVQSSAAVVGPNEKQGPLHGNFDKEYDDFYCEEKTFEKAEQRLLKDAYQYLVNKSNYEISAGDIAVGGDLVNQLTSSHYFAKTLPCTFLGVYAACATSSLAIGMASLLVDRDMVSHALAFTSSHTAVAERQFRFPNEYGIQKKETTTTTVTGAGMILLGNHKTKIKVSEFIPGRIVDWNHKDANDMGLAMAPAAFDTLDTYLKQTNQTLEDFDLIITGDLSSVGLSFFKELLQTEGHTYMERISDCGLRIYDIDQQDVFCGGSGCACSMCVSIANLFKRIEDGQYRRVMVLATGALLSPVAVQQKNSIPCIAHGIVYERSE